MSQKDIAVPEQAANNDFKLLTAKQLSEKLCLPVSWVRNHSMPTTPAGSRIPHTRLGRYVRYELPVVVAWLRRQQCR
jgi:hypothetical protein